MWHAIIHYTLVEQKILCLYHVLCFAKKILIVIILDSVIDSNSNIWHASDIDESTNFNQIYSNQ